jgi:predicted flap endonuclease-1-like 5' DNA nuclease
MTSLLILILLILAAFAIGWLISRQIFGGGSAEADSGLSATIAEREAELAACRAENENLNAKVSNAKSFVASTPIVEAPASEIEITAPIVTAAAPIVEAISIDTNRVDDLKIVEGIGPKIEELLHNAGVKTFAQLASASVADINAILEAAGPRYQMHDPTTWPQQSALCRDNKWTDLKILQDDLNKGKLN